MESKLCYNAKQYDILRKEYATFLMRMIETYFIWFVLYSVLGWIYESIFFTIQEKKFINRGFLNGPFCPIYGCGAILVLFFLGNINNPAAIFFAGVTLTCSLEYLTSWGMEKLFHARWWDYTNYKFNLNGRVCLWGALVFGFFAVVMIKFFHPLVALYTEKIPAYLLPLIALILFIWGITDTAYTISRLTEFDRKLKELTGHMDHAMQAANEYSKAIFEKISENEGGGKEGLDHVHLLKRLNAQERRMIVSFPKLRSMHYNETLKRIRQLIKRKKPA